MLRDREEPIMWNQESSVRGTGQETNLAIHPAICCTQKCTRLHVACEPLAEILTVTAVYPSTQLFGLHGFSQRISGKPESPTSEHARVFLKNLVGEARLDEALPDGEEKKGLIARGRDHG
jgi:hypothetical protein